MKHLFLFLIVFLIACSYISEPESNVSASDSDQIYQYSVFTALANKIYDGTITVSEVKEKGDLGLGTFNGLNGEMIVLNGNVFQLLSDGSVIQPDDTGLVPFTVVTFFDNDFSFSVDKLNYEELKADILENLPSLNNAYAFKIQGEFEWMKCSGVEKQEQPYSKTLSEALVDRPVFEAENISGTMVGFWFPEYIGQVNVAGFHLHFISDDQNTAGHVLDFQSSDLSVKIDKCSGFNVELPETDEFFNAEFDLEQGYN